jgi:hypothetical protein
MRILFFMAGWVETVEVMLLKASMVMSWDLRQNLEINKKEKYKEMKK